MRSEVIPLKRHSDTCPGISRYHSKAYWYLPYDCYLYRMPTQEAYWSLQWDCYPYRTPTQCALSRGILIFAVGLLLVLSPDPLYAPLKRHTDICRGIATGSFSRPTLWPTQVAPLSVAWIFSEAFTPVVIVTCSDLKPTRPHSRDNTVKLSWASHHYCLFLIYN